MLVNRQEKWVAYPEQEPVKKTVKVTAARPSNCFKRNCIQLIVLIAVVAMLVTLQSASMIQAGYDLVQLKDQAAKLEKDNELLRLDIAKLKSPERIQQIATHELGLVLPQNTYYASNSTTGVAEKTSSQTAQKISLVSKAEASKAH